MRTGSCRFFSWSSFVPILNKTFFFGQMLGLLPTGQAQRQFFSRHQSHGVDRVVLPGTAGGRWRSRPEGNGGLDAVRRAGESDTRTEDADRARPGQGSFMVILFWRRLFLFCKPKDNKMYSTCIQHDSTQIMFEDADQCVWRWQVSLSTPSSQYCGGLQISPSC